MFTFKASYLIYLFFIIISLNSSLFELKWIFLFFGENFEPFRSFGELVAILFKASQNCQFFLTNIAIFAQIVINWPQDSAKGVRRGGGGRQRPRPQTHPILIVHRHCQLFINRRPQLFISRHSILLSLSSVISVKSMKMSFAETITGNDCHN